MKPYSTRTYLFSFIAAVIVLFVLLGTETFNRTQNAILTFDEVKHLAADEEIKNTLKQIISEGNRVLETLASWDEVQQQLSFSSHYIYWREQRVTNAFILPNYMESLELYDATGHALAKLPYALFPTEKPQQDIYLHNKNGKYALFMFRAIADRTDPAKTVGYVGIKIDLKNAFQHFSRFVHIKQDGLKLKDSEKEIIPLAEINHLYQYELVTDYHAQTIDNLVIGNLWYFFVLLVAVVGILIWFILYFINRPLTRLEKHIDLLRQGKPGLVANKPPILLIKEIESLRDSLSNYQQELDQVHTHLDKKNIELWHLAHHDALTGVYNRRAFDEDWENLRFLIEDQRITISFMLFDCDHFKAINDTYGHEIGDKVIQIIAEILSATLRKGDKLYRLGGDEFAAILVNSTAIEIDNVAQRCLHRIQTYNFTQLGIKEPVNLSVGLSHSDASNVEYLYELHKQADIAMYNAKRNSRRIVHYSAQLGEQSASLISNRIVNAVMTANESGAGLQLYYQPIYKTHSNEIDFYEILVRISDAEGTITPKDIYPVIERHSLEADFDQAIIKHIDSQISSAVIPPATGLSINLSAASLMHHDLDQTLSLLTPHLTRNRIMLEVTETAMITHLQDVAEKLEQLRKQGFVIALDDFGSGYSSIRYLANMPVDIVKFDIAMVHDLEKDQSTRIIILDTAKMILDAGYQLVAEGVETHKIMDLVTHMGATHLQGYYLGYPQNKIALAKKPGPKQQTVC